MENFYFEAFKEGAQLPVRATDGSAGYDFFVAEDTVIEPYYAIRNRLRNVPHNAPLSLDEVTAITKQEQGRPTLVSTGVKCHMPEGYYLQLQVRSSLPLKSWLIMGNAPGIIDSDYYNTDSPIYFQLINLSPFAIVLKKGDKIGQGILLPYATIEDEAPLDKRVGGFGSTGV